MKSIWLAAALALGLGSGASAQDLRPDQVRFREIYKELVETNTTLSSGSCTQAAHEMGDRLKSAGFSDADITYFADPAHPKDGGIVAILQGSDPKTKPILLLGHLDVVEAKREDWTRDPFTLIEENGVFYGRGSSDMKVIDATWVDMLMRFKAENYRPKRTLKLALTCGEETTRAFNGADWLAKNRPRPDQRRVRPERRRRRACRTPTARSRCRASRSAQKVVQQFRLETTNPGGHSSVPIRDNAIYELASGAAEGARLRVSGRAQRHHPRLLRRRAPSGADAPRPRDGRHLQRPRRQGGRGRARPATGSSIPMLRTTCVATLLDGGHAENALPQRAGANINCRMFPGRTMEETRAALVAAIGDPGVKVIPLEPIRSKPMSAPLDPKVLGPAERVTAKYFPGVPLIPAMSTGASDAIYLSPIGIPTYGVPGFWSGPEGSGAHGLNEHMSAKSVYVGRDFLTDLVKAYAE